jgi:hypothetical protein
MDLEPAPNAVPVNYETFLTPESAQGLDLKGCFIKRYYSNISNLSLDKWT